MWVVFFSPLRVRALYAPDYRKSPFKISQRIEIIIKNHVDQSRRVSSFYSNHRIDSMTLSDKRRARATRRRWKGWRGRADRHKIRWWILAKGCCCRRVREEERARRKGKGFASTNRSVIPGAFNQSGVQPGHMVVGKIVAPFGARFRCVILTFALYRFIGEDWRYRGDLWNLKQPPLRPWNRFFLCR